MKQEQSEQTHYVIIWDDLSFHRSAVVCDWFSANPRFSRLFFPAYSPFLNPLEDFLSAWRWKVYDRNLYEQGSLLQVMEEACSDVTLDSTRSMSG